MWHTGHKPFAVTGADTLIAVSPTQNILFTCDPKLVTQLLRNPAFGKPTALLGLLNVFGPTMTGTDGVENKLYRKVTAPYFHQSTMGRVFRESVSATESFIQVVAGVQTPIENQLRPMLSKMALHVLGKTGFDREGSCLEELRFAEKPTEGHKLSFADTFLGIDQDLPLIALTPPFLLRSSPLQVHKRGWLLFTEMQKYLREAVIRKRSSASWKDPSRKSLLDLLVEAGDSDSLLSEAQVTGNIFILNFAGHESNAHALQFALLNLACRPDMQREVQRDIDRIFGDRSAEQWTYSEHYTALAESMVGAVINESLRLYTVLPVFMKQTTKSAVTVNLDGSKHAIPPNTLIMINTSATHRNPSYWPTPIGTTREGAPYAVSAFNPKQWITENGSFLDPKPGSFIPFSDGPRGCIGQRFAMVELCASLAMLLRSHSIELAVGAEGGNDSTEEKRRKWEAARDGAVYQLSGGILYNMTLRLGGQIPVRFVRRA